MIRPGVAPTIPLHCSDDFLPALRRMSAAMHCRSRRIWRSRVRRRSRARALWRFTHTASANLGVLSPRASAAHAIWLDEEDVALLADHGTSVVHNPLSNARLGSGVADIRTYRDAGMNVGIGTDATNTSDSLNMFEATRWASYFSRLRHVGSSDGSVPTRSLQWRLRAARRRSDSAM